MKLTHDNIDIEHMTAYRQYVRVPITEYNRYLIYNTEKNQMRAYLSTGDLMHYNIDPFVRDDLYRRCREFLETHPPDTPLKYHDYLP